MAKIYAPNRGYTGISAGVPFVDGKGETDDQYLLAWFREHGYQVEKPNQEEAIPDPPQDEPAKKPVRKKKGA